MLDAVLIDQARAFLAGKIRRTPMEASSGLSEILGVPVSLKLECLQETGSFKLRGAWFRMSRLTPEERRGGVATCSAGNHGLGLAYAAREMGLSALVYVPSSVDEAKYRGILDLGAEVVRAPHPGYDETALWALEQAAGTGRAWVPAVDDFAIMAGNGGTLGAEMLEDAPDTEAVVVPVGGGGLAGGLAVALEARRPGLRLIACQHRDSPGLARSLEAGRAITRLPPIETVAGGIEGGIGELGFEVLRDRVDRVALVSEEEIFEGVRWMLGTHRYLIEPSAAVTVAACLTGRIGTPAGPTVVVLSGRNVARPVVERILGA